MENKEIIFNPALEIIRLSNTDIATTSYPLDEDELPGYPQW